MTDYMRPSTWRAYKKNLCVGCHGDCCKLPVEVHINELPQMHLAHESEIQDDLKSLIKKLKKEGIVKLFDQKQLIVTLAQQPDDSCIFLGEDRLCSIYERRPKTCRNFPQVGPRPDFCPWNLKDDVLKRY